MFWFCEISNPEKALTFSLLLLYTYLSNIDEGSERAMKRIKTLQTRDLAKSVQNGGCGECQTSCQSACKTSCGVANQPCEKEEK